MTFSRSVGGAAVSERTYRVVELEDAALVAAHPETSALALIGEREVRHDGQPAATPAITADALGAFLRDAWDPTVGGADDDGVDAKAFIDLLRATRLSPARFIAAHRASGASLAEFSAFTQKLTPLVAAHGPFGAHRLLDLLEEGQTTLAQVSSALASRSMTHEQWVTELAGHPQGARGLRAAWKGQAGSTLAQAIAQPLLGGPAGPDDVVEAGVALGDLAWTLIDKSSDVTAQTSPSHAFNPADTEPTHYLNPTTLTSPNIDEVVYGSADSVDVRVHANVTIAYAASNASYPGTYLSSIDITFGEIKVESPVSLDAEVSFTDISNAGTASSFNPALTAKIDYKASHPVWPDIDWSVEVSLRGDMGIVTIDNSDSTHTF